MATNSSDKVNEVLKQPEFTGGLAAACAVDVQASSLSRPKSGNRSRWRELERKVAELQENYADLYATLFEATLVHRRLCAPSLVRHGDFEIASEIFAVRHLPGDFFTAKEVSGGLVLALGDICGKGLAAGMWTTHLVALVEMHTAASTEPQAIVAGVNRDLCKVSSLAPLASMFLARLDPVTGKLDYTSAGHPPALLLRADGQLELLSEGGPLLGVLPEASFAMGCVELNAGDILLAYSDGVIEASNTAAQEFGAERLEAQLRGIRSASAEGVLFSVLGAVQDFAALRPQEDDMSLVIVRRGAAEDHP